MSKSTHLAIFLGLALVVGNQPLNKLATKEVFKNLDQGQRGGSQERRRFRKWVGAFGNFLGSWCQAGREWAQLEKVSRICLRPDRQSCGLQACRSPPRLRPSLLWR